MAKKPAAPKNNKSFEQTLWDTADKLRGTVESSKAKNTSCPWVTSQNQGQHRQVLCLCRL